MDGLTIGYDLSVDKARDFARRPKNQTEITVHARHYLQEDRPDEIGAALAAFVRGLRG